MSRVGHTKLDKMQLSAPKRDALIKSCFSRAHAIRGDQEGALEAHDYRRRTVDEDGSSFSRGGRVEDDVEIWDFLKLIWTRDELTPCATVPK